MVLKNRRVKIALFAFWGFFVAFWFHIYLVWSQPHPDDCNLRSYSATVIKSKHPIAAGTRLTGDMVRLETVRMRESHSHALVARNVHTYMGLTTQTDVADGEILALDHVYEPHSPPLPIHYYY